VVEIREVEDVLPSERKRSFPRKAEGVRGDDRSNKLRKRIRITLDKKGEWGGLNDKERM